MGSEKLSHVYSCQMGTSNSVKQHKLRKTIAQLSEKEGSEMGFISLYLPPTASIDAVVTNLKNESSAADTKSKR